MSSIDFANYLKGRMATLNLGPTEAARLSGLTRQTWHKLLRADVEEAKISTLRKLAKALKTSPEYLLYLYFQDGTRSAARLLEQSSRKLVDQPVFNEQNEPVRLPRLAKRWDGLSSLQG